ncbi:hypothetical protein D1867_08650 [Acidianus infernus]|uniref:Uncharacterized protein n=1 Tax=Acidianus infernus TaxID=12915 RepID=A0A6A9QG79_ACIIN|nr:hypothetical protein [Acidianus infernus]MUM65305.1 hypothetical protein [Acidianus infernus]
MLRQTFNFNIILLILLIVFLILSIISPVFLLGAIGIGMFKIFGNKTFIPFSILLLLLIGLHGYLYMIGILLALAFIAFNIIKDIYRYYV